MLLKHVDVLSRGVLGNEAVIIYRGALASQHGQNCRCDEITSGHKAHCSPMVKIYFFLDTM